MPRRLRELASSAFVGQSGTFADWEIARRGPLSTLFPPDERAMVQRASDQLAVFAGSFAGGLLVLDREGAPDAERAPVVDFDSEGGITVLGTTFDDFLALLAAEEADSKEDGWVAADDFREWILRAGIRPHASAAARLDELALETLTFRRRWAHRLRAASRQLRPDDPIDHVLELGAGIGPARLGMARAQLDALWGSPSEPAWGRNGGTTTALYNRAPFVFKFDASGTIVSITLYAGRHRARTAAGVDPLEMSADEAIEWLKREGHAAELRRTEIEAPSAKLRLSLDWPRGGSGRVRFVSAVEIRGLP